MQTNELAIAIGNFYIGLIGQAERVAKRSDVLDALMASEVGGLEYHFPLPGRYAATAHHAVMELGEILQMCWLKHIQPADFDGYDASVEAWPVINPHAILRTSPEALGAFLDELRDIDVQTGSIAIRIERERVAATKGLPDADQFADGSRLFEKYARIIDDLLSSAKALASPQMETITAGPSGPFRMTLDVQAKIAAAREKPLAEHGGDRKTDEGKLDQVDNVNLKGGNQAEYLLRRLARDNPEVLDELEAEADEAPAMEVELPRFRFDDAARKLYCGDRVLREWQKVAEAQFAILAAFERHGWPESVAVGLQQRQRRDACRQLNKALADRGSDLAFSCDGDGQTVKRS